jgi:hypothetical protein
MSTCCDPLTRPSRTTSARYSLDVIFRSMTSDAVVLKSPSSSYSISLWMQVIIIKCSDSSWLTSMMFIRQLMRYIAMGPYS